MFDFAHYNGLFKRSYPPAIMPDSRYGVRLAPIPASGLTFRCIGIWHLLPGENGGNHNIFLDVLDQAGNRIQRAEIFWGWEGMRPGETPRSAVVDKPANEPGTNISLNYGQTVYLSADMPTFSDHPSDSVSGLHTRHPDEAPGNTLGHHSFYVVFQLRAGGQPTPPPVDKIVSIAVDPSGRIEWTIDAAGGIKRTRYVEK